MDEWTFISKLFKNLSVNDKRETNEFALWWSPTSYRFKLKHRATLYEILKAFVENSDKISEFVVRSFHRVDDEVCSREFEFDGKEFWCKDKHGQEYALGASDEKWRRISNREEKTQRTVRYRSAVPLDLVYVNERIARRIGSDKLDDLTKERFKRTYGGRTEVELSEFLSE